MPSQQPTVALFATCLVNTLRPATGFACVTLLEQAGFQVEVPLEQTCCGQPGYNNGMTNEARRIAQHQIQVLERYEWIVVPSGSCAGMICMHYPRLFIDDPDWLKRSRQLAEKTRELSAFLQEQNVQLRSAITAEAGPTASIAHHTSCSCRRETRSHEHADILLRQRVGSALTDFVEPEVCCGFGGTFAAKFDAISAKMGTAKLDNIAAAGAHHVVSADLGCLMHLQGLALRQNRDLRFHHIADVLADNGALPE